MHYDRSLRPALHATLIPGGPLHWWVEWFWRLSPHGHLLERRSA